MHSSPESDKWLNIFQLQTVLFLYQIRCIILATAAAVGQKAVAAVGL